MSRTVVVTGGGSGIGEACVRVLARQGWRVIVTDIEQEAAARVAAEVGADHLVLDVADETQIRSVAGECERRFGPVTGLVNSAGILQPPLAPDQLSSELFDRVMRVNFRGTYLTSIAFGRAMAVRGHGAIVAIGSITATRAAPLHAYAPSKAAVVNMVQCLAAEWARSGVRVNAVSPGYVRTPALLAAIRSGERDEEKLAGAAAMGRMVEPSEVAEVVAFLLTDAASAITGVNLPVDAGWLVGAHAVTYGGVPGPR